MLLPILLRSTSTAAESCWGADKDKSCVKNQGHKRQAINKFYLEKNANEWGWQINLRPKMPISIGVPGIPKNAFKATRK